MKMRNFFLYIALLSCLAVCAVQGQLLDNAERVKIEENLASLAKQAAELKKEISTSQRNINIKKAQVQKEQAAGGEDTEAVQMAKAQIAFWQARLNNAEQTLAVIEQERAMLLEQFAASQPQPEPEESDEADAQEPINTANLLPMVEVGETIEVIVLEDPEMNGLYSVREGGYILIPAVGRVRVQGLTLLEAEVAIKTALEESALTEATVVIEKPMAMRDNKGVVRAAGSIFLTGAFENPGVFEIPPGFDATLAKVIIASGGVSETADMSQVRHIRFIENISDVKEVNLVGIFEGKFYARDVSLLDGDIIYIPGGETDGVVYVTGTVLEPGVIDIPKGETLSAYTAIMRAGGFDRFAKKSRVYVMRNKGGGQKIQLPVNIPDIQRGFTSDVVLQDGDIVVVPERFFSF